jgi:hypothetical protein
MDAVSCGYPGALLQAGRRAEAALGGQGASGMQRGQPHQRRSSSHVKMPVS